MLAAAVQLPAAAVAPAVCTIMYPDDHDGDDHNDPEGLIVGEKSAAVVVHAVVVTVGVHKRDSLLDRFLTPYYSARRKV